MQKDLFGASSLETLPSPKMGFLECRRFSLRLDQVLVAVILLLVVYVLVFSFGVETGKRYAMAELKAERAKRELMIHELSERVFARARQEEIELERKGPQVQADSFQQFSLSQGMNSAPQAALLENRSSALQQTAGSDSGKMEQGSPSGKYTIQVITYTSQTAAQRAMEKFAEKGLKGFVIPTGKYLQVCVDYFESREKALASLRHLKMRGIAPPDAYVRSVA